MSNPTEDLIDYEEDDLATTTVPFTTETETDTKDQKGSYVSSFLVFPSFFFPTTLHVSRFSCSARVPPHSWTTYPIRYDFPMTRGN